MIGNQKEKNFYDNNYLRTELRISEYLSYLTVDVKNIVIVGDVCIDYPDITNRKKIDFSFDY